MSRRQKVWDVIFPTVFILLCMAACASVMMLAAGAVTRIYDPAVLMQKIPSLSLWTSALTYAAVLIGQRKNFRIDEMRFGQDACRWKSGEVVLTVLLTAALGHAVSTLIGLAGLQNIFTGYTENAAPAFEGQNIFLLILATVILGPLAEELIFRGMTYRRARAYLGAKRALPVSALLFGLYHGNVIQFIYAFVIGLLLGTFYEKSGSLKLCAASHAAVNLWAILADRYLFAGMAMTAPGRIVLLLGETVFSAVAIIFLKKRKNPLAI